MENLINVMTAELGVKEVLGRTANPQIIKYAEECGFMEYKSDETAWCSLFVNWVAHTAGYERTKNLTARSWLNVGKTPAIPEPGDVVIFWRDDRNSWQGHVGFYMGYSQDKTRVYCLGGNQGDQVSLTAYATERILGFRRLEMLNVPKFSTKNIKLGDNGEEVVMLQDALKQLGYNCGTSDGIFGPKTERCLKDFQSSNRDLQITGVLNKDSREYLEFVLARSI